MKEASHNKKRRFLCICIFPFLGSLLSVGMLWSCFQKFEICKAAGFGPKTLIHDPNRWGRPENYTLFWVGWRLWRRRFLLTVGTDWIPVGVRTLVHRVMSHDCWTFNRPLWLSQMKTCLDTEYIFSKTWLCHSWRCNFRSDRTVYNSLDVVWGLQFAILV